MQTACQYAKPRSTYTHERHATFVGFFASPGRREENYGEHQSLLLDILVRLHPTKSLVARRFNLDTG